ncbi:MAG: hypothetical protein KBS44_01490, partial [Clostridiales bacterium]|nr:hypothetical protein [Candidatus Coliplasma equi]
VHFFVRRSVVQFSMSVLRAARFFGSSVILPLTTAFVNTFFQLFLIFFARSLKTVAAQRKTGEKFFRKVLKRSFFYS